MDLEPIYCCQEKQILHELSKEYCKFTQAQKRWMLAQQNARKNLNRIQKERELSQNRDFEERDLEKGITKIAVHLNKE